MKRNNQKAGGTICFIFVDPVKWNINIFLLIKNSAFLCIVPKKRKYKTNDKTKDLPYRKF